jgi:hypothetical protein
LNHHTSPEFWEAFEILPAEHDRDARVAVPVISGQGRVTAYVSVIDSKTNDPTFVPAQ